MIEIHLLATTMISKVFGMGFEVVVLVLEADFAFWCLPVASAERNHKVLCWMFLPQNKALSVVEVIEIHLPVATMIAKAF